MFLLALLVATAAAAAGGSGAVGTHLFRAYTVYDPMPLNLSAALSAGWSAKNATCQPGLGVVYYHDGAASEAHPLGVAFNPNNGELTGLQISVTKAVPTALVKAGWWISDASVPAGFKATLSVGTRSVGDSCGSQAASGDNGDRLVVNPATGGIKIPLTAMDAAGAGYFNGSCFAAMGWHAFRDLAAKPGQMTWNADTLTPIVPMYNGGDGRLNAIFFTVPFVQNGLFSSNGWDPIPLLNALQCKNTCDPNCTFANTWIWQTMHIFFRDYTKTTCLHGCEISCCATH